MQPLSIQAAAIGNAVDVWREAGSDPKAAPDMIARTMFKFAGSFLDQSFLSGLFDFVEALKEDWRQSATSEGWHQAPFRLCPSR